MSKPRLASEVAAPLIVRLRDVGFRWKDIMNTIAVDRSTGRAVGSPVMGMLFDAPKFAPQTTAPATPDTAEVEEARTKALAARLAAKGRGNSILTGGAGVTDRPASERKQLLGGP